LLSDRRWILASVRRYPKIELDEGTTRVEASLPADDPRRRDQLLESGKSTHLNLGTDQIS
ncbi:MAG: hypothetical protein EBX92_09860, partial [Actinobacteria bacterium]|nr:hypothetical protein [Actinomycetota bacterium]